METNSQISNSLPVLDERMKQKLSDDEIIEIDRLRWKAILKQTIQERVNFLREEIQKNQQLSQKIWENEIPALIENINSSNQSSQSELVAAPAIAAVPLASNIIWEAKNEIAKNVSNMQTETEDFVKNPLKWILKLMGFTPESVVVDFKSALEQKESGDFFGKISASFKLVFMWFLAKILWVDVTSLGVSITESDNKMKEWSESTNNFDADAYLRGRIILENIFLKRESKNAHLPFEDILSNKYFQSYNIIDLENMYRSKKYDELNEKLNISNTNDNKKALEIILQKVFDNPTAYYIRDAYNWQKGYSKDYPMQSVSFWEYIAESSASLSNISDVIFAATKWTQLEAKSIVDSDGEISAETPEIRKALRVFGGDRELVKFLMGTNGKMLFDWNNVDAKINDIATNNSNFNTIYAQNPEKKQEAINKIRDILEFHKDFMNTILSRDDINLGMRSDLQELIKKPFTMRFITAEYMLLGGKKISNFDNLSIADQTKVYAIITMLFQAQSSTSSQKGELHSKFLGKLKDSKEKIPENVMKMSQHIVWSIAVESVRGAFNFAGYLWGLLKWNPTTWATMAASVLSIFPERTSIAGMIFWD